MENLCIFRTELIQNNDKYSHYIGTDRLKIITQKSMIKITVIEMFHYMGQRLSQLEQEVQQMICYLHHLLFV